MVVYRCAKNVGLNLHLCSGYRSIERLSILGNAGGRSKYNNGMTFDEEWALVNDAVLAGR